MTRWERCVVAAVCILVGWAFLVLAVVADRLVMDWRNRRPKTLETQGIPRAAAGRLAGSKEADQKASSGRPTAPRQGGTA